MPFTMTWPDTVYRPQFDVTATVTVTQPYRMERCIYVVGQFSSDPTGKSTGYCYYNTNEQVLRIYDGTQYFSVPMQTRDEGYIYWVVSAGRFYEWTGDSFDRLFNSEATRQQWNHVYINTTSITTQPLTAEFGDWYFNSSTKKLWYYNNYAWVEYGTPWTTIVEDENETALYAFENRLWYYYLSDTTMHPYYGMMRFGISNQGPWVYRMFTSNQVTFTYAFSYPGNDTYQRYSMDVFWSDEEGTNTQYLPETGRVYETGITDTIQGRNGSISTTLSWITALNTYPTVEDEFAGYLLCSPSSTDTASILIPIDTTDLQTAELYGVTWKLAKSGGEGGSFSALTLADAVSLGYVTLTTNYNSSTYNQSQRSFRLKYAGDYTLTASYNYRTSSLYVSTESKSLSFRVYTKASPAIVTSTSPSPTPDPDIYPPSYTVVLHDASSTSNAYQIPQQTITMDAGDNQDPESWTLENTGSSVITIPDKTHVYNGYGQYKPSLTIVDKNGNTAIGYCTFSPNKTARIYTPTGWSSPARLGYNGSYYYGTAGSTITVTTNAHAPILLTAESGVAGDPLPTVTWTYTSSNPSYYNGSVEGAYAELSLLASGTYTVTCTITNGTTTLATYTWSVSVLAEEVSTDADKTMPDFALIVLNGTSPIDYCKVHSCPQYTSKWQDSDTVQFELPINYQYASYLQEGQYFVFGYQGAKLFIVTYRQQSRDTITITGTAVFPERVAITGTRSSANDGYDVQDCSAEALIRYFVHSALTDPYSTAQPRSANFAIHGTCQDYPTGGDAVTYSARYETTQDIVNEICETSGIGYSVGIRNVSDGSIDKCQLWIKQGTDRTYTSGGSNAVIFSEGLKNMRISSDQSALSPNVAIGAGQGTGNYREYTYYNVSGATPTDTGFNRREVFVDAGDAADSAEVKRMSVLELKQNKQLSIKIQVLPSCQWVFGTGYNVGDTVTLVHPQRGQLDLQIFSAEHVRRQTGDELYLNLGSRSLTAPTLINRVALANTYSRK